MNESNTTEWRKKIGRGLFDQLGSPSLPLLLPFSLSFFFFILLGIHYVKRLISAAAAAATAVPSRLLLVRIAYAKVSSF